MVTLQQLRSQIYEALNIQSDDSDIDNRLIDDLIQNKRSKWLHHRYSKSIHIDRDFIQDLNCVDVMLVDPAECCSSTSDDCYVIRTVNKVPGLIGLDEKKAITRLGPTNKLNVEYTFVSTERVPFVGKGKYNKKVIYGFLLNEYIYLLSSNEAVQLIKKINIQGVFVDPREANVFKGCDGLPCWTETDKYPLPEHIWDELIKPDIVNELLRFSSFLVRT